LRRFAKFDAPTGAIVEDTIADESVERRRGFEARIHQKKEFSAMKPISNNKKRSSAAAAGKASAAGAGSAAKPGKGGVGMQASAPRAMMESQSTINPNKTGGVS
jgi:hypothetical protein